MNEHYISRIAKIRGGGGSRQRGISSSTSTHSTSSRSYGSGSFSNGRRSGGDSSRSSGGGSGSLPSPLLSDYRRRQKC